jgi:hypothetical protein
MGAKEVMVPPTAVAAVAAAEGSIRGWRALVAWGRGMVEEEVAAAPQWAASQA